MKPELEALERLHKKSEELDDELNPIKHINPKWHINPIKHINPQFTIRPRRFHGKTFHLACRFCVFPTKALATANLDSRQKLYTRMHHRVVELPKSQQLINFDDESKPLKYAVFEAFKDTKDEPRGGLKSLFE